QTVKLTLHHRPKPKSATYRRLIHRKNQTARISLQSSINVKELHPEAKIRPLRQSPQRARLPNLQNDPVSPERPAVSPARFPIFAASPPPRPVCPRCASAPPVRGLLRIPPNTRNPKISKIANFQKEISQIKQNQQLTPKQIQQHKPEPSRPCPLQTAAPAPNPAPGQLTHRLKQLTHRTNHRNRRIQPESPLLPDQKYPRRGGAAERRGKSTNSKKRPNK
ncbi:hypothetical protein, partial [Leisingera sp. ANG-M1]|uniref:hypothetical protein n=1 Tax=Leisingera sp. ANG-M1 TaxID=1577895 RepID=UPI0019D4114E